MASMSMAASSFIPTVTKLPSPATIRPRSSLVVKASIGIESKSMEVVNKQDQETKKTVRRDMMFAGVAMAVCSMAKIALADEEPRRGSAEAKKKYATVCVTMPTARICRN